MIGKFFTCRECGNRFREDYLILFGPGGIEICEYCWDEINEGLRTPKANKENNHESHI